MVRMRTIYLAIAVAVLALGVPADAGPKGRQVRYVGIHPIPKSEGGGICYIEGPHVHIFAANKLEYRDHRGANYFVGDPVAYGYDGPKYAYKGHHPIHVNAVVDDDADDTEYCYIEGPHYHYFEPAVADTDFKLAGDAYFYVGEPPPAYVEARPAMVKINAVYTPMVYTRPIVTVEPPSGWIGIRAGIGVPAAVVVDDRPAAVVVDPVVRAGVEVHIPTPTLSIGIGIGGGTVVRDRPVYIREHDHGHRKFKNRHR